MKRAHASCGIHTMGHAQSLENFTEFHLGDYWIGRPAYVVRQALQNYFPQKIIKVISLTDITTFASIHVSDPERLIILVDPQSRETLNVLKG